VLVEHVEAIRALGRHVSVDVRQSITKRDFKGNEYPCRIVPLPMAEGAVVYVFLDPPAHERATTTGMLTKQSDQTCSNRT
jgi:hypothetical protein